MSQIYSSLHIMVKDIRDWEKAKRIDWSNWVDAEDIVPLNSTSLILDSEEFLGDYDELCDMVYEVVDALGDSCIVIGKSTNLNVDTYTAIIYYFGDKLVEKVFEEDLDQEDDDDWEDDEDWPTEEKMYMFCEEDIRNFTECVQYMVKTGEIEFTKKEKAQLSEFGIDPF